MLANNCKCPDCRRLWGDRDTVKTGTRCTDCSKGKTCPQYDSRVMYGFCKAFKSIKKGGVVCG